MLVPDTKLTCFIKIMNWVLQKAIQQPKFLLRLCIGAMPTLKFLKLSLIRGTHKLGKNQLIGS